MAALMRMLHFIGGRGSGILGMEQQVSTITNIGT